MLRKHFTCCDQDAVGQRSLLDLILRLGTNFTFEIGILRNQQASDARIDARFRIIEHRDENLRRRQVYLDIPVMYLDIAGLQLAQIDHSACSRAT